MAASLKIQSKKVFHTKHTGLVRPAAVLLIQTRFGNRFLSLKRSEGSELGHWGVLGGMVDEGETPEAAVHREAYEEGNFTPESSVEFLDTYHANSKKYGPTPVHIFKTMVDTSCQIRMNNEHSELGWFTLKDWPEPRVSLMRFLINKYGQNLQHLNPTPLQI